MGLLCLVRDKKCLILMRLFVNGLLFLIAFDSFLLDFYLLIPLLFNLTQEREYD